MMKIAVFVGSLRKASLNRIVFEEYKKLAGSQCEFVEIDYSNYPLYNSDLHQDGFSPDLTKAGDQLRKSDGVLFFTPEYNYSVPGPLKNALDWLSRLPESPFAGKPASVIGASPGRIGTARMQYHLRQIAVFLDLHFMNKPEVMIGSATQVIDSDKREITDDKTREFLKTHFESFKKFAQ